MNTILETNRVRLREILESDAESMFELDQDPEVMRYIGRTPFESVNHCRVFIREKITPVYEACRGFGVLLAEEYPSGKFLGWFHIRPAYLYRFAVEAEYAPGDYDLGFRLRRNAWGQGLAPETSQALIQHAFDKSPAQRVVACAMSENERSRRALEKSGLTRDGTFHIQGYPQTFVRYIRLRPAR